MSLVVIHALWLHSWVTRMPSRREMADGTTPDEVTCFDKGTAGSLRQLWEKYDERHIMVRFRTHADAYERHAPPRNGTRPVRILEIGVQHGGSARAWKQWYGERLRYTGLDIDAGAKRSESPSENIFIEIGSQIDASFLREVCRKHGPFDMVIDDGAHTARAISDSLRVLFPASSQCMAQPASLYVIEDTHTMNLAEYTRRPSDMFTIFGEAIWAMHYMGSTSSSLTTSKKHKHQSSAGLQPQHPIFGSLVSAVHAYDTIIFVTRAQHVTPRILVRGTEGHQVVHPPADGLLCTTGGLCELLGTSLSVSGLLWHLGRLAVLIMALVACVRTLRRPFGKALIAAGTILLDGASAAQQQSGSA